MFGKTSFECQWEILPLPAPFFLELEVGCLGSKTQLKKQSASHYEWYGSLMRAQRDFLMTHSLQDAVCAGSRSNVVVDMQSADAREEN